MVSIYYFMKQNCIVIKIALFANKIINYLRNLRISLVLRIRSKEKYSRNYLLSNKCDTNYWYMKEFVQIEIQQLSNTFCFECVKLLSLRSMPVPFWPLFKIHGKINEVEKVLSLCFNSEIFMVRLLMGKREMFLISE